MTACALLGVCVPAALSVKPKNRAARVTLLAVLPRAAKATDAIDVAFRAGKLRSDERYVVGIGQLQFAGQLVAGTGMDVRRATSSSSTGASDCVSL